MKPFLQPRPPGTGGKSLQRGPSPTLEAPEESSNSSPGDTAFLHSTVGFSMEPEAAFVDDAVPVQKSYELRKEMARGGMGRIFLAQDSALDRPVAVKLSTAAEQSGDSAFYREARILARLSHPNIVPVYNVGQDAQGRAFYSMKLVRGRTLQDVLKHLREDDPATRRDFTLQRLLAVFRKVCSAIEFAHAAGYLHRDLKPDNVMIGEYGEVLVMDWGLARPLHANAESTQGEVVAENSTRYVEGTPRYMSPEQASLQSLDERSDIYSLGAILYAILTLYPPIRGKSLEEILEKVKRGDISLLEASPRGKSGNALATKKRIVPPALSAVVRKAMCLERALRYQNVAELNADIEAYQNGFATSAEDAGALRQLGLLIRRHRALAAVLILSFLGAMTSTVRLSISEREARLNAERAEENARRAEESSLAAHRQELAAKEAYRASKKSAADAMISAAEVAEKNLDPKSMKQALMNVAPEFRSAKWQHLHRRLNTADLTIEATDHSTFKAVVNHPFQQSAFVALLSDGSIRCVDLVNGSSTPLGKIDPAGVLSSWIVSPTFAISGDATRIAVIRNLQSPTETANCQLEVAELSSGAVLATVPLRLSANFLKKVHLAFAPSDHSLLLSSQRDSGVFLIDVKNGCIGWMYRSTSGSVAHFNTDPSGCGQAVFVHGAKEIVELDPETGVVTREIYAGETPYFSNTRRLIPQPETGGFLTTNATGWIRFDPKEERVGRATTVPLGAADIGHFPDLDTIVTVSPQLDGYGVLQFWSATNGELLRSEMLQMEGLSGRDCTLLAREGARRVGLVAGSVIHVWRVEAAESPKPLQTRWLK